MTGVHRGPSQYDASMVWLSSGGPMNTTLVASAR